MFLKFFRGMFCVLVFCVLVFVPAGNVSATSGRLKSASIFTCNGVLYGQHGNGHWHKASRNSNGTYNAVGGEIAVKPCSSAAPAPAPKSSTPAPATPAPTPAPSTPKNDTPAANNGSGASGNSGSAAPVDPAPVVPSWPEPEDEDEILGDSDDEETCNNADCNLGIDDEEYDEWMATVEGEPEKKNEGSNVFGRMLNVLKNLVILGGGVVVVLAVIGGIAGKKH